MALTSPENRLWWKEPLHRMEIIWIAIAFLWGVVMFFTMIFWHINGEQNLSNEAYRVDPEAYGQRVEAWAEENKVREEGDTGIPVVRPPAGGDAYMLARSVAVVADPRTEEGTVLSPASVVDGLAARLVVAADQHQYRSPPELRNGHHHYAEQERHLWCGLQRILRRRPFDDGRPDLRRRLKQGGNNDRAGRFPHLSRNRSQNLPLRRDSDQDQRGRQPCSFSPSAAPSACWSR